MEVRDLDWDLATEAQRVHIANEKWWYDLDTGKRLNRNLGEMCMLMVSELAEALEAYRKNLHDDHLPQYWGEHVEIADCLIRALDTRFGVYGPEPFNYFERVDNPSNDNVGEALLALVHNFAEAWVATELEILDWAICSLFWYADWRGFLPQLREIFEAKMVYNASRIDHTPEHRRGPNGKKI